MKLLKLMISLLLLNKFSFFIELYQQPPRGTVEKVSCVIHNHRVVPRISNPFTIAEHYSGPRGMTTDVNLFSAPVISVQVAARECRRGSSKSRIEISPWGILAPRSCVKSLSSQWKDSQTCRWIYNLKSFIRCVTIWKKEDGNRPSVNATKLRCISMLQSDRVDGKWRNPSDYKLHSSRELTSIPHPYDYYDYFPYSPLNNNLDEET